MNRRTIALASLSMILVASLMGGDAAAATSTVVRPGKLHAWIPFDMVGPNGRWVTGPGTPPLGAGSARLRGGEALEYDYQTPSDDLATFVATYESYGSAPATFGILTDADVGPGNFQDMFLTPSGSSGWHPYDATGSSAWEWDCDGDGNPDGTGSIADFGTDCNSTAKVAAVALIAEIGDTYVDEVVLGPTGSTTTYDFEPPLVSVRDRGKTEGDTGTHSISFRVRLSGHNDEVVHVRFATANGSAIAGKDYIAKSGTLKIPAGAAYGIVKVSIIGDTKREPNETFKLKLSAPVNAMFGDKVAIGKILDDD